MKSIKRNLLIICGTLFIALAIVGILFPILPTTPFLLLAAYCYGRSSKRFYDWLMNNRVFGTYIRNYRAGLGIPLKQKIFSITLLWVSIGYSVIFVVDMWWLRILLLGIAVGVTIHLVSIKTYKAESEPQGFVAVEELE
ncbi:MAG: YbaN family protein [Anaerolineaceae bacterium]|nr:YbaN family protein [Anaerolineaceae bacterium]